jgi:AbrB family looped-hinge helix DNA binding protein
VVWLEEPLPRFDFDSIARLSAEVDIPIAGGEANAGLHEFKWLIERRCYDILQPDATLSEGIFQLRKVAGMAEAFGLQFVPHTWADGVGMAANLQLAASVPNCGWLEFPHDPPNFTTEAFQALLVEPLRAYPLCSFSRGPSLASWAPYNPGCKGDSTKCKEAHMARARVTSKGHITVPKAIRERLGVEPGDLLEFRTAADRIEVMALRRPRIREFRGLFRTARAVPFERERARAWREQTRRLTAARRAGHA